jgi:LAO/AO transport system kinase
VVKVLDAAGFQVIMVETVGAGQAEVDIANAALTTLVIEAPGMGDDIQTIKAGILEIADILVVNKVDRPGSDRTVKALQTMLHMGMVRRDEIHHGRLMTATGPNLAASDLVAAWDIPLLETVATDGRGVSPVVDAIQAHRSYLHKSGDWLEREKIRSRREIDQLLQDRFMSALQLAVPLGERETVIEAVARRQLDPYSAVERLFEQAKASEEAL